MAATTAALICIGVIAAGAPLAPAKSKTSKGTTKKVIVQISGANAAASPVCPNNTHATGGGFYVSSGFIPEGPQGTQTRTQINFPPGKTKWRAGASVVSGPPTDLFTYARCEKNAFGKVSRVVGDPVAIAGGLGQSVVVGCPLDKHVLGGGYSVTPTFDPAAPSGSTSRMAIVQNRRTSARTWTVSAINPGAPAAQLSVYALCEKNGSPSVSQKTDFSTIRLNSRFATKASCASNQHIVAGGWALTPLFPVGSVPIIVDASRPNSQTQWAVLGYSDTFSAVGSGVTAYAYCRTNKLPS